MQTSLEILLLFKLSIPRMTRHKLTGLPGLANSRGGAESFQALHQSPEFPAQSQLCWSSDFIQNHDNSCIVAVKPVPRGPCMICHAVNAEVLPDAEPHE